MTLLRLTLLAALVLPAPGLVAAQAIDPTFVSPTGVYAPGTVYSMGPAQADGKRLLTGYYSRVNNAAYPSMLLRLDANGATDAAFAANVGAATNVYRIKGFANGQYLLGAQGGSITAGGLTRTEVMKLNVDGTADASFDSGTGPEYAGSDPYGNDYTAQPDNKVLVTGYFTAYNGVAANGIVRLNANGTVDTGFNTGTGLGLVAGSNSYQNGNTVAVQADGKILVGGSFTAFNGSAAPGLVRLLATGGVDASFNAPFNNASEVTAVIVQPDGKLLVTGYLTLATGGAPSLVRLNTNGTLDTSFNSAYSDLYGSGFGDPSVVLQPDGKLLVCGYSTAGTLQAARLNANGSVDASFYAPTAFNDVYTLGVQPNGTVLVGGTSFYSTGTEQPLVRLTATGALDAAFAPKLQTAGSLLAAVRQPDGRLLLAGNVTEYNGVAVHQVLRVSAAGVLDAAFGAATTSLPSAATSLALQPDGKVLVGTTQRVVRLNATGSRDGTFAMASTFYTTALALQADGKVLAVSPYNTTINGVSTGGLLRLTANGAIDPTFSRTTTASLGTPNSTDAVLVQADGNIVVSGRFTSSPFPAAYHVVRYLPSGALDASFNNTTAFMATGNSVTTPRVYALVQQPDGKLLAGGSFTQAGSSLAYSVTRLTPTGDVDAGFAPTDPLNGTVYTLAVQPNGRVLVGGSFTARNNGTSQNNLTRLLGTGAADASYGSTTTPNSTVRAALVQPDGGLVVAGSFTTLGSTAARAVARLTAPNVLAVGSPSAVTSFSVWPVPARGLLHATAEADAQGAELLDALGRVVQQQALHGAGEFTLATAGLPAGIYVLRVQYARGSVARRVAVE